MSPIELTRRQAGAALASLAIGASLPGCATALAATNTGFDVDDLERRTFGYFWETANPANGLVPDRWPSDSFCSIAAVGFGLTAYPVAVERGWITRADALRRTLTTLRFFDTSPKGPQRTGVIGHKGFFYHFLDMNSGHRFQTTELSSIDTVLFLAGALFAAQYFDRDDPAEAEVRALATKLNNAVDWKWMLGGFEFISMGWRPENGFISSQWDRYNEATLLYILALGSPTYAVDPSIWRRYTKAWSLSWGRKWGEEHLFFPPHFGHQYSHVWVDFRGIRDPWLQKRGLDLFENSRRATRAQRNYAIANPKGWTGYGDKVWGLTACDGPGDFEAALAGRKREFFSYSARGPDDRDDGTLAPTAMAASLPFEPALVMEGLGEMMRRYGSGIYGRYGFLDSFNPTLATVPEGRKLLHGGIVPGVGWVDKDYLGIDQGPIIAMIANHRDDFVWKRMRTSAPIVAGLRKAGFAGGWLG